MKNIVQVLFKLLLGIGAGYTLSHHISHPSGRVKKHVPIVRLWRIQLMPNLLIATKKKRWHIHHWAYLPAFYLPLVVILQPLVKKHWLHGFVLGVVSHGLTFEDRFRFSAS